MGPFWNSIASLQDEQEVALMMWDALAAVSFQDTLRVSLSFQVNQERQVFKGCEAFEHLAPSPPDPKALLGIQSF